MKNLLTGDIGGTKTLLQIETSSGVSQQSYASAEYASLQDVVSLFLRESGITRVDAACFALAGPVAGRIGKLTNLPWPDVDADALAAACNIGEVTLINDFAAVGYGLAALRADDLVTLQAGNPQPDGVRLATGPGTGLGVVWLTPQGVHASEGGHADFAPVNEVQKELLFHLRNLYGRATYERIVSGPGLVDVFNFLCGARGYSPPPQLRAAMTEGDAAAAISHFARQDYLAREALDIFISVYGAFVGDLALTLLPRGGIYLAGGISAKIVDELRNGGFLRAFRDKGRFAWLLESFPVHVVTHPTPGLLGARAVIPAKITRE
ncbi:MAG: glucokinase [Gallionellaceae bacterium]|jgi:glucokinase|nr:glucokinase [Gallionellaceae bacterium]